MWYSTDKYSSLCLFNVLLSNKEHIISVFVLFDLSRDCYLEHCEMVWPKLCVCDCICDKKNEINKLSFLILSVEVTWKASGTPSLSYLFILFSFYLSIGSARRARSVYHWTKRTSCKCLHLSQHLIKLLPSFYISYHYSRPLLNTSGSWTRTDFSLPLIKWDNWKDFALSRLL